MQDVILRGNRDMNGVIVGMYERESYKGGLTCTFFHGELREEDEVQYYDIVSMYPSVLAESAVPVTPGILEDKVIFSCYSNEELLEENI